MTAAPVERAGRGWLELREPIDGRSRASSLIPVLEPLLPTTGVLRIHDLGSGTGSMRRWLAPQLRGPQTWVEHDRDPDLLRRGPQEPPTHSRDGFPVTVHTRTSDLEFLDDLEDASLVTASALLDVLTLASLQNLTRLVSRTGAPCLLTLSVVGRVVLRPPDPMDNGVQSAFNAHQQRMTAIGSLLGPEAVSVAAHLFDESRMNVRVQPSPWHLGPECPDVLDAWLDGWVGAAREHDPGLDEGADAYRARRQRQTDAGQLHAVVHHVDLLAWPT